VDRIAELRANLDALRDRIAAAGRDPDDVTIIAVTKTFPASDVGLLAELGLTEFGENRDAEAKAKAAEFPGLRWHFVGQLQRNKARSVVTYADCIHSVDRPGIVDALDKAADRDIDVLLQVGLERTGERGGADPAELTQLADAVNATDRLKLRGLMAVAPLGKPPEPEFRRLADIAAEFRANYPNAEMLSAGMTGDLEAAIRHGATHLRIGTALLGRRPPIVR
jgi:pyridoxal phosphate enzyme (YggS family)